MSSCPSEAPHAEFQSIEDINNYLLQHKEVTDLIGARGKKPKFVFLMFDEADRKAGQGDSAARSGSPRRSCARGCDNKIETVRIGNKAGVPSVPNVRCRR